MIFRTSSVQAILRGWKTQTRRVALPQPPLQQLNQQEMIVLPNGHLCAPKIYHLIAHCPYGNVGERIHVRESFFPRENGNAVVYRADFDDPVEAAGWGALYGGWTSPLFMPNRFCRLVLEITDVRFHRVQEITDSEAKAEAATQALLLEDPPEDAAGYVAPRVHRHDFLELWDRINFKRGFGWDTNPFVWALTFKRVQS